MSIVATGIHHCANRNCRATLEQDHVVVTSTRHTRRFCDLQCVEEGQQADLELTMQLVARDHENRTAHREWALAR